MAEKRQYSLPISHNNLPDLMYVFSCARKEIANLSLFSFMCFSLGWLEVFSLGHHGIAFLPLKHACHLTFKWSTWQKKEWLAPSIVTSATFVKFLVLKIDILSTFSIICLLEFLRCIMWIFLLWVLQNLGFLLSLIFGSKVPMKMNILR